MRSRAITPLRRAAGPDTPQIQRVLAELRVTMDGDGAVDAVIAESTARLTSEPEHRDALREEIRELLSATTSTHLLTEYGILSDETLTAGVLRRLGARWAPAPARSPGLDTLLADVTRPSDAHGFDAIAADAVVPWVETLLADEAEWESASELASAMVILATRVAGAGVDPRLSERLPSLEAWNSPFVELSRVVDRFAEAHVNGEGPEPYGAHALGVIGSCEAQIKRFRAEKEVLGTTLYLSSMSLRMLQQLERLTLLIECCLPDRRARAVSQLGLALVREVCRRRPVRHFVRQKLDLLAYLVVGHAAQKGDKYAVRSRREYWGFWRKSLLGGVIVAVFASLKLAFDRDGLALAPQALLFGANYALCFALIYLLGGTLATKQPALTASRIADALEGGPEHESFPELIRSIWQSQFVSFLGNIVGAGATALALAVAYERAVGGDLLSAYEADALRSKLHPTASPAIWYAAVAGVMLSVAGFVAGFVDNAVVFHRVADRVTSGRGMFRCVPKTRRDPLARRVEKHAGALTGNVVLGFMLGSAGSVGIILGLPFDIRHVAFASSHGSLSLWYSAGPFEWTSLGVILLSVSVIGLVNFLVSFGLTLAVAADARRLEGVNWRRALRAVGRLVASNPLGFFLPLEVKRR